MKARGLISRCRQTLDRVGRLLLSTVPAISFIACNGPAATTAYASPAGEAAVNADAAASAQNSYADLVARVAPAVVTVRPERRVPPPHTVQSRRREPVPDRAPAPVRRRR